MKRAMVVICFDVDESFEQGLPEPSGMDEETSDRIRGLLRTHFGASFPHGRIQGMSLSQYNGPPESDPIEKIIQEMDEKMLKNLVRHHAPAVLAESLFEEE